MISAAIPLIIISLIPLLVCAVIFSLFVKEISPLNAGLASVLGLAAVMVFSALQIFVLNRIPFRSATIGGVLVKSVVFRGLAEELVKMLVLFLLPCRKQKMFSFMMLSVLFGLALGGFESVIYAVTSSAMILPRLLTSVVIHGTCAGLCGLFVYSVKSKSTKPAPVDFINAALIHGIYDFFAGFNPDVSFFWFSIPVVLVSLVECRIRYRAESSDTN